jgi:prepilin-type N-terminal cleavage/methylation domain-containing protein
MMNDRRKNRMHRGFTLVEVLIALAILGIGIVGVTVLFPAALHDIQRASGATVSALYADSVMDDLKARGYRGLMAMSPRDANIVEIITRADETYRLYEEPDAKIIYLVSAATDLYATVVVNVPLPDGRVERYVTYIARQ